MRIKILFLFLFILFSASVFSQKVDEDQVPKDVLIAVETIYSGVKVKTWELKDNNYFATVKIDGQTGKAEISPEGKWLATRFSVNEKELPTLINKYMMDNFDTYKIKVASYVENNEDKTYYELKIQKKGMSSGDEYELTFDTKGNLINSTAPESAKVVKKKDKEDEEVSDKKDKVVKKKSKKDEDEDVKSDESDDKPLKSSKSTKTSKETSASKTKSKKSDDDEDTGDEKPVKKSSSKKSNSDANEKSSSTKTKTQKSSSSSSKSKKKNDDDEGSSKSGSAPALVKKIFQKKFPNNAEPKWTQVDSNYIVSFLVRDMEQKAEFTPDGKIVSTTAFMDVKNLYKPIDTYLDKNYKKYKVLDGEKVIYDRNYTKLFPEKKLKSYYKVKISQKVKGSKKPKLTTIYFDSKGVLDRVDEGDFDDDDQGDNNKKSKKDEDSEE